MQSKNYLSEKHSSITLKKKRQTGEWVEEKKKRKYFPVPVPYLSLRVTVRPYAHNRTHPLPPFFISFFSFYCNCGWAVSTHVFPPTFSYSYMFMHFFFEFFGCQDKTPGFRNFEDRCKDKNGRSTGRQRRKEKYTYRRNEWKKFVYFF